MKNLKLIALATLMALPMSQSLAQDLSFTTARALMHERADAIKMDQAVIEQTQFQVKEAKSLSGPKVMLNAQQVEGRKDIGMNLDIGGFTAPINGIIAALDFILVVFYMVFLYRQKLSAILQRIKSVFHRRSE